MRRGELSAVIALSVCEAGGSGREKLNRYPPSRAFLWIVNVPERKTQIEKKISNLDFLHFLIVLANSLFIQNLAHRKTILVASVFF